MHVLCDDRPEMTVPVGWALNTNSYLTSVMAWLLAITPISSLDSDQTCGLAVRRPPPEREIRGSIAVIMIDAWCNG